MDNLDHYEIKKLENKYVGYISENCKYTMLELRFIELYKNQQIIYNLLLLIAKAVGIKVIRRIK